MRMSAETPESVTALLASFEKHGFTRATEHVGTGFGDRSIELDRTPVLVRITSDRGQWFVEVAHRDWDEWFDADVWRACLEDSDPPDEPRPLDIQSAFLLRNLGRIAEAGRANAVDLLPRLRQAHAARARRRLGF